VAVVALHYLLRGSGFAPRWVPMTLPVWVLVL
jgi:hypothetical protein